MTANDQKIAAAKAAVRKRVVGYIRVSDPKQELKYGPQAQRADIEEYCAKKGYELLHIYYDAMTGVIWRERPGLTALRDAARLQDAEGKGPFEAVVVGRLDRLAREDEIQTVIMEDLAYHCVKTESATEKIEDSPAGRFMLHVYGFMAAEDRKRIIQRTDDGRRARAREGKLLGGGPATYGYKWNEDRTAFLVNDDVIKVDKTGFRWTEAKVVKFVFQKYKEGWSIRRIRLYIQELGIPTRKGKSIWQDSMIHNILKNSYYAGKAAVYRNKYHIVSTI
jgi:site-specific DNA recombinase